MVQLLIDAGVNVNQPLTEQHNPTMLLCAICTKNLKIAELLLAAKADPNIPNADGMTPLMEAVVARDLDAARLLVGAGADPFLVSHGRTAIGVALATGNTAMVNLLNRGK